GGGDAEIKIIDLSDDSNGDEPEAKTVLSGTGAFSVTAAGAADGFIANAGLEDDLGYGGGVHGSSP
ncbi:MAG: hypothetical protein AAGE01_13670, partial [Pseudomonadota bacterium]